MKKQCYLLLSLTFLLLLPLSSWAKKPHATQTPTVTATPTDTATSTITDTPTITPTVNVALGHKFYTFDTLWNGSSDPINDPEAIAIAPSGHMVIADSGNNRVVVWDADGKPLKSIGSFGPRADWRNPCLLYTSDAADDLLCVD